MSDDSAAYQSNLRVVDEELLHERVKNGEGGDECHRDAELGAMEPDSNNLGVADVEKSCSYTNDKAQKPRVEIIVKYAKLGCGNAVMKR